MKHPFLLGAIGYPLLEILFRGRTHPSMALAGGLGCMAIRRIGRMRAPLPCRSVLCGLAITGIEAGCGLIWNRRHQVWDYCRMPLQWRGQVCVPYTLLWCLLSGALMRIDNSRQKP